MKTKEYVSEQETTEKIGYSQIFSQKEYCKIILANIINRFGDSIDAIAFTWLVYEITGSASWSAIIYALNVLPTILLQPFAGAVVERRSKKKLMVISDLMRGLVVVALSVIYVTGELNPWIMAAFMLTISSVEAFCTPASTAIIPLVLEEKYYEFGMSLNSVASTVMQLIGTGAAGVIIGAFGVEMAIFIDAVTFFGSALIKMCLKVKEDLNRKTGNAGAAQYFADLKGGFSYLKEKSVLLNFCILAFLVNAMLVPINSFQAPLVSDVLGQKSELLSVLGIASVIGSGVGSILFPHLSKKVSVRNFVFINGVGLALSCGVMTLGALVKENWIAVYAITAFSSIGLGLFASTLSATISVQFLKSIDRDYLARAQSILGAGATAAMPLTSIFLSIVVNYVSVKDIIIACSVICAVIFIGFRIGNMKFEEENEKRDNLLQSD